MRGGQCDSDRGEGRVTLVSWKGEVWRSGFTGLSGRTHWFHGGQSWAHWFQRGDGWDTQWFQED